MLYVSALGSLIGATALNGFSTLPSPGITGVILIISMGLLLFLWLGYRSQLVKILAVGFLTVAVGFGWAYYHAYSRLKARIPLNACYTPVEVSGTISGMVMSEQNQRTFLLQSKEWGKIRLYWRGDKFSRHDSKGPASVNTLPALKAGDELSLKVTFTYPWRLANPGSFDNEQRLLKEGINGIGNVLQCLQYQPHSRWSMARIRQYLLEQSNQRYADKPLLPMIQATTLGLYGDMTPHQFDVFAATGTLHAIAISGSHIAMIAWFCTTIVTFLTRFSCSLTNYFPAQHVGAVAGMCGAGFYAGLAGFGLPTQRALLMIMIAMGAVLTGRKVLTWDLLALAWLGVGVWDPLATLDKGFWLSFGCVAILIAGQAWSTGSWWRRWLLPQWLVFLGTIPASVFFFKQIAFVSPIANMLTLPVLGFLVVPLSLLTVLLLAITPAISDIFMFCAHGCLRLSWRILEPLAALPLCWSIGSSPSVKQGECQVTLLDVGQGLSVFVQTRDHTLLFDTGPTYGKVQDAGSRVIKPFLKSQHITSLDTVIISHADLDHRGGWASLQDFPIKTVYSSEPDILASSSSSLKTQNNFENHSHQALLCEQGKSWQWNGVDFTFMNRRPMRITNRKERNNQSCILKISTQQHSILITGDIEKEAERALIQDWGARLLTEKNSTLLGDRSVVLQSNILVVPHHGSMSSSTRAFVESVSPQYALYPAGFHNRYGLPKREILERYRQNGAINLVSYEKGAIIFTLGGVGELTPPLTWRDTHRRYWHR